MRFNRTHLVGTWWFVFGALVTCHLDFALGSIPMRFVVLHGLFSPQMDSVVFFSVMVLIL